MVGEVWQIGDVKITRVVEIEATGGMNRIIPDAKRELVRDIDWLSRISAMTKVACGVPFMR